VDLEGWFPRWHEIVALMDFRLRVGMGNGQSPQGLRGTGADFVCLAVSSAN
jgi:hypothetical protein